jgi:Rad3-related DNA helicase
MDELGRMILNLANIVPDGIIVFFPSYSYEEKIVNHWTKTKLVDKIELKKKVKSFTNHLQILVYTRTEVFYQSR